MLFFRNFLLLMVVSSNAFCIVNGQLIDGSEYAIWRIHAFESRFQSLKYGNGQRRVSGYKSSTATAISADTLLASAHALDGFIDGSNFNSLELYKDGEKQLKIFLEIKDFKIIRPRKTEFGNNCFGDIALIKFKRKIFSKYHELDLSPVFNVPKVSFFGYGNYYYEFYDELTKRYFWNKKGTYLKKVKKSGRLRFGINDNISILDDDKANCPSCYMKISSIQNQTFELKDNKSYGGGGDSGAPIFFNNKVIGVMCSMYTVKNADVVNNIINLTGSNFVSNFLCSNL